MSSNKIPEHKRKEYIEEYKKKGFFIIPSIIDKYTLENSDKEIHKSDKTIKFFDRNQNLRRIECIYDKGPNLLHINNVLKQILLSVFKKEFIIFKDKYNAKPPGGEGFFAHYDGIFHWKDYKGKIKNGWHIYGDEYISTLVAIDDCTLDNGTIEISNIHKGSFSKLIKNTKMDGTPNLICEVEQGILFEPIVIKAGDAVVFSSRCPHRSRKNNSNKNRRTIYYTYNPKSYGDNYSLYFSDKLKSKNKTSKSLSGEI